MRYRGQLAIVIALAFYIFVTYFAVRQTRDYRVPELKYVFPEVVTQILSFGDPYLAANINYARVVTLFNYSNNNLEPRVLVLEQAISLNPKQLDLVYQSAVIPWESKVNEGLDMLVESSDARYWDSAPIFMQGVTRLNFTQDYTAAAENIAEAARRTEIPKRQKYYNLLAARTHSRGDSYEVSLAYIEGLMKTVQQDELKQLLNKRAERIRILFSLRDAAERYRQRFGKKLENFDQLLTSGILAEKPEIIGMGYDIDSNGNPDFYEKVHVRDKR